MESLFELLGKIGEAGWIVAAVFGYGYYLKDKSKDKLMADYITMQKSTIEALHANTIAFNTHTAAVNSFKDIVAKVLG